MNSDKTKPIAMDDAVDGHSSKVEVPAKNDGPKDDTKAASEDLDVTKQCTNVSIPQSDKLDENELDSTVYYGIESDKDKSSISIDHCYARPWNWKAEFSFLRPTKTLFIPKNPSKFNFPGQVVQPQENDELIDIEAVENPPIPIYDVNKAKQLMEECEQHVKVFKNDEGNNYWEEAILNNNWTSTQIRLFNGVISILNNHQLAKLASKGVDYEAICRRSAIDKSVQRLRRLMATVFWDPKLTQWLHHLLVDNLSREYLGIYLDILQTLKGKLPSFVEKMINSQTAHKIGSISTENLLPILKRTWDPVSSSLMQDKPKKLPGNPVIVVVPSSPVASNRYLKWIHLLSNLATVVDVPFNMGTPGQRLTTMHSADQMFASIRGQVQEIKNVHPNKNIVLLGFNAGAAMALQVAQVEPVLAVICLGFSLLTAEGKRGEPDDTLLEQQTPVLFVIGQCSTTSSQEDMEDLRERMRVETGLVVVGSADNFLRISKKKKRTEGITQSVVDRCIVDEIGEFISGIILSPFPPQIRQSPAHVPADAVSTKKNKVERKRYNSNASSLDSEDPLSSMPNRISRPVGRPPGSKSKSKLEVKWAAQVAQAKMQAYGMARHNIVSGSRLSTLLRGGIKTIPPTQPKTSSPNIKSSSNYSVLENLTFTPGSKLFSKTVGKTVTVLNPNSSVKQTGSNVILMPDGKIKTIATGNLLKGPSYITSKKQLLGNRPPKPTKRFTHFRQSTSTAPTVLPPPTNLTSQDIMDLPIIFADDNQILDAPLQEISPPPPPPTQHTTPTIIPPPKIISSGSKFVLVNKPVGSNPVNTHFVISQNPPKKPATVFRQTPKYTKIILSKRAPVEELKSSNIISRIANLSPEISVKKISSSIATTSNSISHIESIDVENELIATSIVKPAFLSDRRNVPTVSRIVSKPVEKVREGKRSIPTFDNDDEDSDPDYIPPKVVKLN